MSSLTNQQTELLKSAIMRGATPADLSNQFGIGISTVHYYKSQLKKSGLNPPNVKGKRSIPGALKESGNSNYHSPTASFTSPGENTMYQSPTGDFHHTEAAGLINRTPLPLSNQGTFKTVYIDSKRIEVDESATSILLHANGNVEIFFT